MSAAPAFEIDAPTLSPEKLSTHPPEWFIDALLERLEEPIDPDTGEKMWESGGMKLFGEQRRAVCEGYRYSIFAAGLRRGKSWTGAFRKIADFLWLVHLGWHEKYQRMLWWTVGPNYDLAREEITHAMSILDELGVNYRQSTPQSGRWTISFPEIPGWEMWTFTSQHTARMAARSVRGIVITEAGQQSPDTWEKARERTTDSRGWVLMEGTFEVTGPWFSRLFDSWRDGGSLGVAYSSPTWENVAKFPGGFENPEIQRLYHTLPRDQFDERWGGIPGRSSRLMMKWADRKQHVRRRFPDDGTSYDPADPVYLGIDPGTAHAFAVVACQFEGKTTWVVDIVYMWDAQVDAVVEECAKRPWAARVVGAVFDVASKQRRAEGDPVYSQWKRLWRETTGNECGRYAKKVSLKEGYDVHNTALRNAWDPEDAPDGLFVDPYGPKIYFDPMAKNPMFGGHVHDRDYPGEYNAHQKRVSRDNEITSDIPVPRDDDAIKAISYLLYWRHGKKGDRKAPSQRRRGMRADLNRPSRSHAREMEFVG